jgi:acylphosphatase
MAATETKRNLRRTPVNYGVGVEEQRNEARVAVRFLARGRVQGVGFRFFVARQARRHEIAGWVRNREDGAVEGEAAAAPALMEIFLAALRRGPPHAAVREFEVTPLAGVPVATSFHIVG